MALWTQTYSFKRWVAEHNTALLACLSPQYPDEESTSVMIHYDTGDYYKGYLKKGKRDG